MEKIDFKNYPNRETPLSAENLNLMQNNIEEAIVSGGGDALPIGTIMLFSSETIPENWFICDGRAISRIEYAKLYNVIGVTYGSGDGSTTFNIPDLRGKVPVGYKSTDTDFDTLGETGGEKTHTLTIDEMPEHNHDQPASNGSAGTLSGYGPEVASVSNKTGSTILTTGGSQSHNNLQPYIVTNYIIKAYDSATGNTDIETLPVGTELDFDGNVADIPTGWEQIDDPSVYSTTEKVIGKWIDGKSIYRKVIDIGNLPNDDVKNVSHNIGNLSYVTKIYLVISTGSSFYQANMSGIGNIYSEGTVVVRTTSTDIQIGTNKDYSTHSGYAIIEYTKTTN